ncbi:hypothetical protein Zmor_015800 [Zophobas morio]|uniref:Uncharacterized protein n=1 Tax=Zophobas morio TaxID=2755281 RepID=A0AA38MHK7_9CUCU|nr:hypothetical protein Zmor_015800 [Zophobas morio]
MLPKGSLLKAKPKSPFRKNDCGEGAPDTPTPPRRNDTAIPTIGSRLSPPPPQAARLLLLHCATTPTPTTLTTSSRNASRMTFTKNFISSDSNMAILHDGCGDFLRHFLPQSKI